MIFNVLPDNFFNPLASKNKKIYADCIFILYKVMSSQLSFGVEKDIIIEELKDYFDSENTQWIEEDEVASNSRDKANLFIRKLTEYGWLSSETTNSYVQIVHFNDYVIEIIKSLENLSKNNKLEYQGYIYTIYSLVQSNNLEKGILVKQIYENTDKLITGLKSLNSNIKKYIDELTKHHTVAEIMNVLFNDYRENIVDKAYHRLKTSDNVSKFRPQIVEALEHFIKDEAFIKEAGKNLVQIEELENEQGEERAKLYIKGVLDAFYNIDFILDEIDRKNANYQKSAINRARFLLTSSEDVTGQVKTILQHISKNISKEDVKLNSYYFVEYVDGIFKIFNQGFIDEASLYAPIEGRKEFKPNEIEIRKINKEKRKEKLERITKKLENSMTSTNINGYVQNLLGEKEVIFASNIKIESIEDVIKIIYIRLYGQRKKMNYKVVKKDTMMIRNGFEFKDFEIWRKI